jgi:hypothetical protein
VDPVTEYDAVLLPRLILYLYCYKFYTSFDSARLCWLFMPQQIQGNMPPHTEGLRLPIVANPETTTKKMAKRSILFAGNLFRPMSSAILAPLR